MNHFTAPQQESLQPVSGREQQLGLYKALGDGLRLNILRLLKQESFGVLELCKILEVRQPALSHHLKLLAQAGLVTTRREGNSVFYRRPLVPSEHPLRTVLTAAYQALDESALEDDQRRRIEQVQRERADMSLSFFHRNAAKFREQQGLIVAHEDYVDTMFQTIAGLNLSADDAVLEVGPGQGQILAQLADSFADVTGLDNSAQMLELSRQTLAQAGHEDSTLVLGETSALRNRKKRYSLILFDMVLHHIASPAETMADCHRLLKNSGHLLIVDLSSHDQDWVRQSCGDLWLGFELDDLRSWAEKAGLQTGPSEFLALRNGFQVQLSLFSRDSTTRPARH